MSVATFLAFATRLAGLLIGVVVLTRLLRMRLGVWLATLLVLAFAPVVAEEAAVIARYIGSRVDSADGLFGLSYSTWNWIYGASILMGVIVLDRALARAWHTGRQLRDSEERLRSIITAAPDLILIVDADGTICFASREIGGIPASEIAGLNVFHFVAPSYHAVSREAMAKVLESGEIVELEVQGDRIDGSMGWFSVRMGPIRHEDGTVRITSISTDITERKHAEEALRRNERLASMGTFATGIAHEINNPLGAIVLSAQMALRHVDDDDRTLVQKHLEQILDQAKRCGRIVKSVLRFARQEPAEKWPENLNRVIRGAVDSMAGYLQEHDARVSLDLDEALPAIVMNPLEMGQVFINLLTNAVQSGGTPPEVVVSTRCNGKGVEIVVRDNGCGLPEEHADQIFDPFFTTRRHQGGTGLGLSLVHSVVRGHGGTIQASTLSKRQGAEITINLPLDGASVSER